MNRKELINLAKENGVAKAHQTKTVTLEEILTEMGVIGYVEKRGRPVDSNSVRQMELNRKEFNRENGVELRGRKVDPNSARQIRLREMEEKRANGTLRRGRPKKEVIDSVESK